MNKFGKSIFGVCVLVGVLLPALFEAEQCKVSAKDAKLIATRPPVMATATANFSFDEDEEDFNSTATPVGSVTYNPSRTTAPVGLVTYNPSRTTAPVNTRGPVGTATPSTSTPAGSTVAPTVKPTVMPNPQIKDITVKSKTKDSLTITWTAENATKYKVYCNPENTTSNVTQVEAECTGTEFTITGLKAGASYNIKVDAINERGNASASLNGARTMVGEILDLKLNNFFHLNQTSELEWQAQFGANGYEWELTTLSGKKVKSEKITNAITRTVNIGVKANHMYIFKVRAYQIENNQTSYGDYSECLVYEQPWISSVKLCKTKLKKKKVTGLKIKWEKQADAKSYDIYVAHDGSSTRSSYKKVASVKKGKTSYTLKKFKGNKIKGNNYYAFVVSKFSYNGAMQESGATYTWKVSQGGTSHSFVN